MNYPHPCTRCGFCCLSQVCPVGQAVYKTGPGGPCPGITFEQDQAVCGVITHLEGIGISGPSIATLMGLGKGCCIKARAIKDGITYDFAGIPPEFKVGVVRRARGTI